MRVGFAFASAALAGAVAMVGQRPIARMEREVCQELVDVRLVQPILAPARNAERLIPVRPDPLSMALRTTTRRAGTQERAVDPPCHVGTVEIAKAGAPPVRSGSAFPGGMG